MANRLLVDLEEDALVTVSVSPERGLPEKVASRSLDWPLDDVALEDLRWYLEDYLKAPFGVWEDRGPDIQDRLDAWGQQIFGSVFADGPARDAYQRARDRGVEVVFRSAVPRLLGFPWELMRDGEGPVALRPGGISRSLPVADAAATLEIPGGRLRVLMVISRPAGTSDVGYQMVARPLLERLDAVRGEVALTVLRPPTFDAFSRAMKQAADNGEPFHVVHFDGHGTMPGGVAGGPGRPVMFSPRDGEGLLAFEQPSGGADLVSASRVARVLADGQVPVVVLNACQSGALGKDLEASVAAGLLRAGCAAVVAMAYRVYAVAAAEFMTAFYESIFTGGTVSQAVTAGRRQLARHPVRPSPRGEMPLADWIVPVHYLRQDVSFPQARATRNASVPTLEEALNQIRAAATASSGGEAGDPLAAAGGLFVGRDDLTWQLETAARLQHVVVLTGQGGTGKTELAKGFARWLRGTGGVSDPRLAVWQSFEPGAASPGLDRVIAEIGLKIFGTDFARLDPPERLNAVKHLLTEFRVLLIWDNFESVVSMPDPGAAAPLDQAEREKIRGFLTWVREHSHSIVIITSRTAEEWLGEVRRITVGGLNRAEAAEYADFLLAPCPRARAGRAARAFGELLEWLDGCPLAMRLTLPQLDAADPGVLLAELRGAIPMLGAEAGGGRLSSLGACITYSFTHLSEQAKRLLPAITLFRGIADANLLSAVSADETVPDRFAGISREKWGEVLDEAARVGLLTEIGVRGICQIHPALPGYLTAGWQATDPRGYHQEREACEKALCTASARYMLWLTEQEPTLAYVMAGLQQRTLGAALGRALDLDAWDDAYRIVEALDTYWDNQGLGEEAAVWSDRILNATTRPGQYPPEAAGMLWLHTTITLARRQHDAGQPDQADETYRKALAYLQGQPQTEQTRGNIGTIFHQLGVIAEDCGRLQEADNWYRRSLTINEELSDRPGIAADYNQLGNTADRRGQLDEADDWHLKSLTIYEELGDRPCMAITYHGLGMTAQHRGRWDEADHWYWQAIHIREKLRLYPLLASDYHQLGITAGKRGRLDEAEEWFRKSLTIQEELGGRRGPAATYAMLGATTYLRGRLDEAEDWYRKSLAIYEECGDRHGAALTYGDLGRLAEARNQAQQALEWSIRCVSLFDQFPSPLTGSGPAALARLTARLGTPALEATWASVTGQALPRTVRDYVTSHVSDPAGTSD